MKPAWTYPDCKIEYEPWMEELNYPFRIFYSMQSLGLAEISLNPMSCIDNVNHDQHPTRHLI